MYLSNSKLIVGFSAALFLSYLCGFLLCILVELPFKNLMKLVIFKVKHRKKLVKEANGLTVDGDKIVQIEMNGGIVVSNGK